MCRCVRLPQMFVADTGSDSWQQCVGSNALVTFSCVYTRLRARTIIPDMVSEDVARQCFANVRRTTAPMRNKRAVMAAVARIAGLYRPGRATAAALAAKLHHKRRHQRPKARPSWGRTRPSSALKGGRAKSGRGKDTAPPQRVAFTDDGACWIGFCCVVMRWSLLC